MKHAQLLVAALGIASLALSWSTTPVVAHEPQEMRSPHAPCDRQYEHHMEHGMMGENHGMEHGHGYGGMFGVPMMAPGQGRGGMGMGPGMMTGPNALHGSRSHGMGGESGRALRSDLSTDEVRHMMEHRLEWMGNPNLKLGKVEESGEDEIIAEIVTQDGSLVQRLEVDKHTGGMRATR